MRRSRWVVVGASGVTAVGATGLTLLLATIGSARAEDSSARSLERQIHSDDGGGVRAAAHGGPVLTPQGTGAALRRSLAKGGVQRSGTFWLGTGAGRLEAAGAQGGLGGASIARDGRSAVFARANSSTALGVRPTPVGFTSYVRLPNGVRSTSWTVSLPARERLHSIGDGGIAVIAPRAQTVPRASASASPLRNRAAGRGAGALSATQGGTYAATLPNGWRMVARISAPVTTDAAGRRAPTALSHRSNRITLRVRGSVRHSGALTARTSWSPTGDLGNGFWSHGSDQPVRSADWSVKHGKRTGRGCGYVERGTLGVNEVEEARDLAVAKRGCKTLVETGNPYGRASSPRTDAGSPTAGTSRKRRVHRNKAYNKSIQEDPVQIDVNSVKDIVDWRWNRRCVRGLRLYDATDAYGPTGWELVKRNRVRSRRCKETTMQTYAKFRGGQYFPACTGFKVTTIYANNIVQGQPRGKAGYWVYRITGGPPCHKLLHWDRIRRNRRIY